MDTPHNEADTRAKLIDPMLHLRGWTEAHIKREETAGAIEIIGTKPRRRNKGKVDYVLRLRVNTDTQPIAVALIEAKAENLPPTHGLEQGKLYAKCKRLNIPFVLSSNGHQYVEFDRFTGKTTQPVSMDLFPTPDELRRRYEEGLGFKLSDEAAKPLLARYPGGEGDAAVSGCRDPRVLEKIARCDRTKDQNGRYSPWRRAPARPLSPFTFSSALPTPGSSAGRSSSAIVTSCGRKGWPRFKTCSAPKRPKCSRIRTARIMPRMPASTSPRTKRWTWTARTGPRIS
jgi:hypothetical protein